MTKQTKVADILTAMLKENTGKSFLDSGGIYGRNYERNRDIDFEALPEVTAEVWGSDGEVTYTVSVYHYLKQVLALDALSEQINAAIEADSDIHWTGELAASGILERFGVDNIEPEWNTYNGESSLSQVLQGFHFSIGDDRYVALQIHGGCDVRGGYTRVRVFRMESEGGYIDPLPFVYGEVNGIRADNGYYGYCLSDEDGNKLAFPVTDDSDNDDFSYSLQLGGAL